MKLIKSYTARIDANASKDGNILFILSKLNEVSEYVFNLGKDKWFNQKEIYHQCRKEFPELHSKILQQFLKLYCPIGKKKLPKNVIKSVIILDNQTFDLKLDTETKFTNYWLRFGRKNYPLRGKNILSRIKDISCVQECRIYLRKKRVYCKLTYVEEKDKIVLNPGKSTGIDINVKQLVSSDNKFYSTKKLFHRKQEHKKNRMKHRDTMNFTKDFVHKLTTLIVSDLIRNEQEVLVLEDLKNLRQSSSKKNRNSKGKVVNYLINNCLPYGMFTSFLEYKCKDQGIKFVKINPYNTSKECNNCKSLDSSRPKQSDFICNSCGQHIHADLNAARNIRLRYTSSNELPVNPIPYPAYKKAIGSCSL